MSKTAQGVVTQIEIGTLEAIWVLGAHVYALLMPLVLCWLATHYGVYLGETTDLRFLLYVAAVFLAIGSAFEVAQNAIDHWYLTPETASGNGTAFCDALFFSFITVGQLLLALAMAGRTVWVLLLSVVTIVLIPLCYPRQSVRFVPLTISGLLMVVTVWLAFGDPAIVLTLLLAGVTVYFFTALLETGAQSLHGFATIAASSGLWFVVIAVQNSYAGTRYGWTSIALVIAIAAIVMAALRPLLCRLPASRRVY